MTVSEGRRRLLLSTRTVNWEILPQVTRGEVTQADAA